MVLFWTIVAADVHPVLDAPLEVELPPQPHLGSPDFSGLAPVSFQVCIRCHRMDAQKVPGTSPKCVPFKGFTDPM